MSIVQRSRRGIRTPLAGVAVACALVLSACAGLPTSGPVEAGLPIGEQAEVPDFAFRPAPPPAGASPQQIVEGFLAAGSGPQGDWATAREYLAPEIRETWQPEAGVTIDVGSARLLTTTAEDAITVTLSPEASVDDQGAYDVAEEGAIPLPFRLAPQSDGEWRITEAPDGIVLDQARFRAVFRSYSLMYFDPTWSFLVPDVRWYATNAATRIASALVDGTPTPWLAEAVATSFPDNVELEAPAVPVQNGVAEVDLQASALTLSGDTLDLMQTQLEASLATAGVTSVQLTVASQPIEAAAVATRSTQVQSRPLVLTEEGFGLLSGGTVEELPGLSPTVAELAPISAQLAPDRDAVALRLPEGEVVVVRGDGSTAPIDDRSDLIAPTVDASGYIWSVPRNAPSAVIAVGTEGDTIAIADAWPGAGEIIAMQISRDGTRMAAILREGDRQALWIAGVVRDTDGVPDRLGAEPARLATLPGAGIDIGWLDATTVGVVAQTGTGSVVVQQTVGGEEQTITAPAGITTIAGANQATVVRLRDADGVLYVRRGTNWQRLATGIEVLATQQGSPD